jgi:hypothetical protein
MARIAYHPYPVCPIVLFGSTQIARASIVADVLDGAL